MNKKRYIGGKLWLVCIIAALSLILTEFALTRRHDYSEAVAARVSGKVEKRLKKLEGYVDEAMKQPFSAFLELPSLPEDMVVYRYSGDSLESWCHQFSTDNDDIGSKVLVKRLTPLHVREISSLADADGEWKYLNIGYKWYLARKYVISDVSCLIAGLEIRGGSLRAAGEVNPRLGLPGSFSVYPLNCSGGDAVLVGGQALFKVLNENISELPVLPGSLLPLFAALLLLTGTMLYLVGHKSLYNLLPVFLVQLLQVLLFYLSGRWLLSSTELFSPLLYADGPVLNSLGSLLIINLFIVTVIVDVYVVRFTLLRHIFRDRKRLAAAAAATLLAIGLLLMYVGLSMRSLVLNSNISQDLRLSGGLGTPVISVLLSYLSLLLMLPLLCQLLRPFARHFLNLRFNVFSRSARVVFALLISAFLISLASVFALQKEHSQLEIWANRLAVDRNLSFELMLRRVENGIASDRIIADAVTARQDYRLVLGRVTDNYLSRIAEENDVNLYIFKDGEADSKVIEILGENIRNGQPVTRDSRFYYSRSADGRARYTGLFSYYNPTLGVTRLLLDILPKPVRAPRGYAAILGSTVSGAGTLPPQYSYAKYISGKLVSYTGNYAYSTVLDSSFAPLEGQKFRPLVSGNYRHFADRIQEDEVVVISRKKADLRQYLLSLMLMWLVFFALLSLMSARRRRPGTGGKNYYKSRINTVVFVSLVLNLAAMALISVLFVYRRNEANQSAIMSEKMGTIQSLMGAECRYMDNIMEFTSAERKARLNDIGNHSDSDITLYTPSGKAVVSTNLKYFGELVPGSRLNEEAYRNIVRNHRRYFIGADSFRGQRYNVLYAPVFNYGGNMIAIMASPYTGGPADFRTDALEHSLLVICTFLILMLLSNWGSDRVVDRMFLPLVLMGRKMSSASTTGLEYIEYDRDDEIATLVRAYNLMVHDLAESSKKLAQAERDKAWSEMARQVAHEIKNPLTPIKLQIQRIMRLKTKGDPLWAEKFDSMAPVILDSIENLTDTANEFSTFAHLYSEEPVRIDLDRLLQDEVSLFASREDIAIEYVGLSAARVTGPKPQLTRVIVNLLTNAVQACEGGDARIFVSLRISEKEGFYDIVVEDNGPGVSDENLSHLFTPNFTTKSGGTGLGLAICKSILERCGGEIYYSRSFTLGGAAFTVRFPKG